MTGMNYLHENEDMLRHSGCYVTHLPFLNCPRRHRYLYTFSVESQREIRFRAEISVLADDRTMLAKRGAFYSIKKAKNEKKRGIIFECPHVERQISSAAFSTTKDKICFVIAQQNFMLHL